MRHSTIRNSPNQALSRSALYSKECGFASGRPYVIVVDDDIAWASALVEMLSAEGYEVEIARDGESGLDLIERSNPSLVILDVQLPRLGGLDVLRELSSRSRDVRVIMVSGEDHAAIAAEAMKYGAATLLRKPVPDALLLKAVRRFIRN